jgi:polyisoprenoid-binding protein YceI
MSAKEQSMFTIFPRFGLLALMITVGATARAADSYAVDPVHSSISFMISHAGLSLIHGRFNDYSGKFTIDKADPTKSSFSLVVKVDTVDTNNKQRDEHLRAPDYFNTKQFPELSFQSTKVKAVEGGYEATGDFTMHGVTKPITLTLKGGDKTVEFPKGTPRIAIGTTSVIKRSNFDMKEALDSLGDDVAVSINIEAVKQ